MASASTARTTARRAGVRLIGMHWWLTAAFAAIAAVVAVAIVLVTTARSGASFRASAVELAAGNTLVVAERLRTASSPEETGAILGMAAERRQASFFVVDDTGAAVAYARVGGVDFERLPGREDAVAAALDGRRFIRASEDGGATLVAIPLRNVDRQALVSYTLRPEIGRQIGIVRSEVVVAAAWAIVLGLLAGSLVATLIARRLRRIARTARAIEAGDFGVSVRSRFPDEIGRLADSIDFMRAELSSSFAALADERDRLDLLLGRLSDGVVAVDRDGCVTFANERARRLLGAATLGEGEPLPEPWEAVSLQGLVRRLATDQGPVRVEVRPDDGEVYRVTGVAGVGLDAAILVIADLSDQERSERAQRDFVTNASHELRTPVAAILSSVEMLQAGAKDDVAERDEFLDHIERESARLARLTRALLVLARAEARSEAVRLEPVSVRDLLTRVASGLDPRPGVEVSVRAPAGLEAVVDPDVAEQAITAIATNASKYTSSGAIELWGERLGDGRVRVAVSDTGPGMERAVTGRVVERFYRPADRDRDAFGLGLSIARQSVAILGGDLELRSTPDVGTTVTVTLPGTGAE